MLFDCDPALIRSLMKKKRLTAKDVKMRKVETDEDNPVVYVGAKSERGLTFVKEIMCTIPQVATSAAEDEESDDEPEPEEEDEEEEDEEDEDVDLDTFDEEDEEADDD